VDFVRQKNRKGGSRMKKTQKGLVQFLISALLILAIGTPPLYATEDVSAQLSRMEQQCFSRSYSTEDTAARLDRLETEIYGASRSAQPENDRIEHLAQFFETTPSSPPSIPSTATKPSSPKAEKSLKAEPETPAPSVTEAAVLPGESEYPIISTMEEKVFHQTYEKEPIENRLARLEQKMSGQTHQGSLQDRTDQLKTLVLGESEINANEDSVSQQPANQEGAADKSSEASADMLRALPPVETKVLGQSFPQDTVGARLGRIETKLFNQTASDMSPDDRFYRITSVLTAKSSSFQDQQAYSGSSNSAYSSSSSGSSSNSGGGFSKGPAGIAIWGPILLMVLMSLI
jgi:hypothetical protein